jgi:peptidoglycan/xylan/chitin deacetylase (PgdA/CDA1 family)
VTAVRRLLKTGIERLLLASGAPALARRWRRDGLVILGYHNIVPDGERPAGDLSLHLPQREFARQLDRLSATHDVVPLGALPALPPAAGRPRAVITFDDAYAGAVTAGVAELARRGLPGTIFVVPAFVDGGTYWWDELAADGAPLDEPLRAHALDRLAGRHEAIMAWAQDRRVARRVLPDHCRGASETQLRAATATPGITLGSHTWSHPNLTRLAAADFAAELARPRPWLEQRFSAVVPWVSYPYGLSAPDVERAGAGAGYRGGLLVTGGSTSLAAALAAAFRVPRLNVPAGMSADGLALRAAGLL